MLAARARRRAHREGDGEAQRRSSVAIESHLCAECRRRLTPSSAAPSSREPWTRTVLGQRRAAPIGRRTSDRLPVSVRTRCAERVARGADGDGRERFDGGAMRHLIVRVNAPRGTTAIVVRVTARQCSPGRRSTGASSTPRDSAAQAAGWVTEYWNVPASGRRVRVHDGRRSAAGARGRGATAGAAVGDSASRRGRTAWSRVRSAT